jgi:hypothetical protein
VDVPFLFCLLAMDFSLHCFISFVSLFVTCPLLHFYVWQSKYFFFQMNFLACLELLMLDFVCNWTLLYENCSSCISLNYYLMKQVQIIKDELRKMYSDIYNVQSLTKDTTERVEALHSDIKQVSFFRLHGIFLLFLYVHVYRDPDL